MKMKMPKGPALFSEIGREAADLLTSGYLFDRNVTTRTNSGQISTWLICPSIVPSTKTIATLTYPNFASSKVECQYFHPQVTLSAGFCFNKASPLDFSCTLGNPTFGLGAEASYKTGSRKLAKYSAAIFVKKPEFIASMIMGDKGDTIKASYIHWPDQSKKFAVSEEMTKKLSTNENMFAFGGSYAIDSLTTVKMKLNNRGMLGASLQHGFFGKLFLTISSEVDTNASEKVATFALSYDLKL